MTDSMVERVAKGMEEAEFGYEMKLISLIDEVSTYRLTYSDGEVLEFGSSGEVYEHVAQKKRRTQARAAIEAIHSPTEAMIDAGADAYIAAKERAISYAIARNDAHEKAGRQRIAAEVAFPHDWLVPVFNAMVRAALEEGKQ
ncbi:hypothetical protein [Mesorhizobium amorphae]|uniref:hypothetical protein n=1 Tax=Mesorhizobium amorphae TaxID=71433 RepID=UPI0011871989|nr:hypothetical protein [Mesorhizobium amorphae]